MRFEHRDGLLFGEMKQGDSQIRSDAFACRHSLGFGVPGLELDESLPIQSVSTGMWFTMVPFRTLAKLQKLTVNWSQMAPYCEDRHTASSTRSAAKPSLLPPRYMRA